MDNITTLARQLVEPLSPVPLAVTDMLSVAPITASSGIVTLRVAFPLLNAATTREVGKTLGDHPALSATVNE
jgi:hypothetical protein